MSIKAVLTGDIINSSLLKEGEYRSIIKQLEQELVHLREIGEISNYEIYRGDAFQAYLNNAGIGLNTTFKIRTAINSIAPKVERRGQQPVYNVRLGLGIGPMRTEPENMRTKEPPFVLSGQALEEISGSGLTIAVKTEDHFTNQEFQTELYLLEYIQQKWTPTSAGIIYKKLQGATEQEIADELGVSQSAVNQHSSQAYWNGIKKLMERYKAIIKRLEEKQNG